MEKVLLSPQEAAEALGIGRTKLYELLRQGELQTVRVGGCRRVPADEVRQFVERLREMTPPPVEVSDSGWEAYLPKKRTD